MEPSDNGFAAEPGRTHQAISGLIPRLVGLASRGHRWPTVTRKERGMKSVLGGLVRTRTRRWIALGPVVTLLAVLGAVAPSTSAFADGDLTIVNSASVQIYYLNGPVTAFWHECRSASTKAEYIFLETSSENCGSGLGHVYGDAGLITNSSTSHTIVICSFDANAFHERVNVANADGSASATVLDYIEYAPSCYQATKGYPMRKFRVQYDGAFDSYVSYWASPYPA